MYMFLCINVGKRISALGIFNVELKKKMDEKDCSCAKGGCSLSLVNKDHLNVAKKKHEMALNLGLISKNETSSDQTPTPTRFIRNCEEVGLFQDLQYVNPFEETFKKAVELTKNGQSHVPQAISDDTLHTPHILPHFIEEKLNTSQNLSDPEDTEEFNINSLHMKPPEEEATSFNTEVLSVNVIKDVLKLSDKTKPTARIKEKITSPKKPKREIKAKKLKPQLNIYDKNIPDVVKRREMNRVAQMRYRRKRKELHFDAEHKLTTLKKQNEMLMLENFQLMAEVRRLNLILKANKNTAEEIKRIPPERPIMPKINSFGTLRPILLQAAPVQFVNVANISADLNVANINTEVGTLIRPEDIKVEIDG